MTPEIKKRMEATKMKTLKNKTPILLVLLLTLSLLLAACGTAASQTTANAGSTTLNLSS